MSSPLDGWRLRYESIAEALYDEWRRDLDLTTADEWVALTEADRDTWRRVAATAVDWISDR